MSIATASTRASLLCAQRLPKAVQAGLAASLGDEQHARAVEIVDDGEIAMALAEALLVDAQVGNRLCRATFEPTLHGAFQDAVNLVPAQRQQLGDALLAGFLQPRDRESFKQRGEAAGSLGPGQSHDARPVLGAVAARRPGVQDRAVLTGVEVTPAAFGLMIVECAHGAALAARPADLLVVFEEDVDFAVGSAQLHSRDFPGTFDAQNLAV